MLDPHPQQSVNPTQPTYTPFIPLPNKPKRQDSVSTTTTAVDTGNLNDDPTALYEPIVDSKGLKLPEYHPPTMPNQPEVLTAPFDSYDTVHQLVSVLLSQIHQLSRIREQSGIHTNTPQQNIYHTHNPPDPSSSSPFLSWPRSPDPALLPM